MNRLQVRVNFVGEWNCVWYVAARLTTAGDQFGLVRWFACKPTRRQVRDTVKALRLAVAAHG